MADSEEIKALLDTPCADNSDKLGEIEPEKPRKYKGKHVAGEIRLVTCSFLLFQLVELFVMFTITMSNERLNIEAPVLRDSILDLRPIEHVAAPLSEFLLFSYQVGFVSQLLYIQ